MSDGLDGEYNVLPPITIGGPTGDYFVECSIQSAKWCEFAIIGVTSSAAANYFITGDAPPKQLKYDGSTTLSDNGYFTGIAISTTSTNNSYSYSADSYYRVTHSQKRVFVRIDTTGSNSAYISIRFRVKQLTLIPGPAPTVHPDQEQVMNMARSMKAKERLDKMKIPGYILDEAQSNGR